MNNKERERRGKEREISHAGKLIVYFLTAASIKGRLAPPALPPHFVFVDQNVTSGFISELVERAGVSNKGVVIVEAVEMDVGQVKLRICEN